MKDSTQKEMLELTRDEFINKKKFFLFYFDKIIVTLLTSKISLFFFLLTTKKYQGSLKFNMKVNTKKGLAVRFEHIKP